MRQRIYLWLLRRFLAREPSGSCGNRREWTFRPRCDRELFIRATNLDEPHAWSREELYRMLATIRKHEQIQGWLVPEPDVAAIKGAR